MFASKIGMFVLIIGILVTSLTMFASTIGMFVTEIGISLTTIAISSSKYVF